MPGSYPLCSSGPSTVTDLTSRRNLQLAGPDLILALVTYNRRTRGVSTHREKRMRAKMVGRIADWVLQPIHSGLGAGGGNRINWERADSNL